MSWLSNIIGYDNGRIGANLSLVTLVVVGGLHAAGLCPKEVYDFSLWFAATMGIQLMWSLDGRKSRSRGPHI